MSFDIDFIVDRTEEATKDVSYQYIDNSGIYNVNIIDAFFSESNNGSTYIELFVDYEGQKQVIYGNILVSNNDGKPNNIGRAIFNGLLVVTNVNKIGAEDRGEENLPIGKGGELKPKTVIYPLRNQNVKMKIQLEYSLYRDEIKSRKVIKGFYREDGATPGEVIKIEKGASKDIIGSKLKIDEQYASNIYYKNNLTEADIIEWVANGRQGGVYKTVQAGVSKPNFNSQALEDEAIPF